ncbi:hypothetical protein EDB83DRAFT_2557379 [Lactarius deliciosus]|nr:hypothetical protein EDB83DRAFT_2557379 [Lactarius deliciosus]
MPDPSPETSTPAPSLSFSSLPAAISLQHNADLLTPFNAPNLSSLAPVLDDMIPTESRRSIATITHSAYPGPTSAPDLNASAEDDGSSLPVFHKEQDAVDLPSVNRAIHASTTSALYFRPQLPSVTDSDVAILGPSLREPNAERSEDPPGLSHCSYDIV